MDDNQFATSDDSSSQDPYFATEVNDEPTHVETSAPAEHVETEKVEHEPEEPKSLHETLEAAFDKAEGKEVEAKEVPSTPEEKAEKLKTSRAPQSWKPEAREMFEGVPEAVKNEILRREADVDKTLRESAPAKRLADAYLQTAQPYEQFYQSRGTNSLAVAKNLFEADRILSTGSPAERAQAAARIITSYGVDLNEFENHLVQQINTPQQQVDPALQQRLAQLEQHTYNQQQQVVQQQQNAINNTISSFASDPKNEFFNDVRTHMGALLEKGLAKDLQDAYDQACYANPEVRKVLTQRGQQTAQRAAAGNTSLPSKGPRNVPRVAKGEVKNRRELIESLFNQSAGGRV